MANGCQLNIIKLFKLIIMAQTDKKQPEWLKQYESYKIINEITDDDKRYTFSSSNQPLNQKKVTLLHSISSVTIH